MTKSLEEAFGLPPIKDALAKQAKQESSEVESIDESETPKKALTADEALENSARILNALSMAEKVDYSLTTVDELDESDLEMDTIALEALESYTELKDLAMNMSDAHSARMMEVASQMLKTSLEAKEAKINRKLKTIDLQLKKMRMDRLSGKSDSSDNEAGVEFDRNDILQRIYIQREEQ